MPKFHWKCSFFGDKLLSEKRDLCYERPVLVSTFRFWHFHKFDEWDCAWQAKNTNLKLLIIKVPCLVETADMRTSDLKEVYFKNGTNFRSFFLFCWAVSRQLNLCLLSFVFSDKTELYKVLMWFVGFHLKIGVTFLPERLTYFWSRSKVLSICRLIMWKVKKTSRNRSYEFCVRVFYFSGLGFYVSSGLG